MPITFAVDAVERAREPLPTRPLSEVVSEVLGEVLALGGDPSLPVVESRELHPLVTAVHLAFSEHRPLVLSPDTFWLTIAQGVALHVRLHAEELAEKLVGTKQYRTVQVTWNDLPPTEPAEWSQVCGLFHEALQGLAHPGFVRLMTCDFSTSSEIDRTASEILLMDSLSEFFEYQLRCLCGIPEITLLGTVRDYQMIAERIEQLDELGLEFWTRSLRPIARQLVRTAEGHPDIEFWKGIYKPHQAYGPDRITGWVGRLFPYLNNEKNPLLALTHEEVISQPAPSEMSFKYAGPGIDPCDIPNALSTAMVRLVDPRDRPLFDVQLLGGLLAVEQDAQGRLVPRSGFAVRKFEVSIASVLEKLQAQPGVQWGQTDMPKRDDSLGPKPQPLDALRWIADLKGLYRKLKEATLFADSHPVRLRPASEFLPLSFTLMGDEEEVFFFCIADLSDGTVLAVGYCINGEDAVIRIDPDRLIERPPVAPYLDETTGLWFTTEQRTQRLSSHISTQPPEEIPIVGRRFIDVLDVLLNCGGEPNLPELRRLSNAPK